MQTHTQAMRHNEEHSTNYVWICGRGLVGYGWEGWGGGVQGGSHGQTVHSFQMV